jgi:hypothetical protein
MALTDWLHPVLAWKENKLRQEYRIARRKHVLGMLRSGRGTVSEDVLTGNGVGPLLDNDSSPLFDLLAYATADAIDETSFREMQRRMFALYKSHPLAHGWVEQMVQFVVGDEFQMKSCDHDPRTQEVWDKHAANMAGEGATRPWPFPIFAQELVRRALIFGEDFQREFVNDVDGSCMYRKMHPVWIYNPGAIYQGMLREWTPLQIASFGIQTDPQDIMRVLTYYYDANRNGIVKTIPGDQVIHTKLGDADMKRGEPFMLSVVEYLIELERILKSQRLFHAMRTEVAWWDELQEGADPEVVKDLMKENESTTEGINLGRQLSNKPGSLAMMAGIKRVYATPNLQAADCDVDVRRILQCISVGLQRAYHSISGDASNEDMASIRETTFPQVRSDKGRQKFFGIQAFEYIGERVIQSAIDHGTLPADSYKETREVSKADPGIISKSREKVKRNAKFICLYPEIQIRDVKALTDALVVQSAQKLVSKRSAQIQLGYNADEEDAQIAVEELNQPDDEMMAMQELMAELKAARGAGGNGKDPHVLGKNGRSDSKAIYRRSGNKS